MSVSAWRVHRSPHTHLLVRRVVVVTPDYPSMTRWLARTEPVRRCRGKTLWLEDPNAPAVTLPMCPRRPRRPAAP
jgi:hypothetical protein